MTATILAYHTVVDAPAAHDPHALAIAAEDFARQMDELAGTRTVVSLDDAVHGRAPAHRKKPVVAITFDDGYRGVLRHAAPILRAHGFAASIFVPTAHLGGHNRWDGLDGDPFCILDPDELCELDALGVTVESHGHGHIPYDSSDAVAIADDINASTDLLEQLLGRRPRYLAYPFGPSSPEARRLVADAGYRAAFSIARRHEGDFAYGRVAIQPSDTMRLFNFKTSGRFQAVRHHPVVEAASALSRPVRRRVKSLLRDGH